MNPSYFDVSKIKSMSVVSGDKEYVQLGGTRAAESNPTVVDKSWLNSKDGMLNVTLNLDASKIKDDADHVTVLAVQAHFNDAEGNDTTVTSDYAAVAKSTIKDVVIADATIDGTLLVQLTKTSTFILQLLRLSVTTIPTSSSTTTLTEKTL